MEDTKTCPTPWLTFSLALANSASLAERLRQHTPDTAQLRQLLERYCARQGSQSVNALTREQTIQLHSDATARKVDEALEWESHSDEHHLISLDHPEYPPLLRNTAHAPLILYAKGHLSALRHPPLAVVGSRKASHQALSHTSTLSELLAESGLGIVSGLALGIDAAAHEGALRAGGITLCIAATEPDKIYPRRHANLFSRILDSGGLSLSEAPIGTPTRPYHFPQRNRIISGMSLGVLVAEASLPSGTMTTATHAMDQGRDVMAVPGSVHNLQARGCHALIKQGAALVETVEDVLDVLQAPLARLGTEFPASRWHNIRIQSQPQSEPQQQLDLDSSELSATERTLLDSLSQHPASLDELLTHIPLSVSQLSAALGLLEIRGMISTNGGGRYARC